MAETRKPGGGRKPSKPEYSAEWNLTQQMDAATALYKENHSLQSIADALSGICSPPIKSTPRLLFKAARSRTEESTWAGAPAEAPGPQVR